MFHRRLLLFPLLIPLLAIQPLFGLTPAQPSFDFDPSGPSARGRTDHKAKAGDPQAAQQQPPARGTEAKSAEALPPIEQILDKYVQAIGGKAAIQAPTSRVIKGTITIPTIGAKGTIEIFSKAPNKELTEIALSALGNSRTGFNGTIAWQEENGVVKDLPVYAKREADFYLPMKLRELYPRLELKGKEKIGDREVYRLEAPRGGNPKRWYFDVENGLLLRTEARNADGKLLNRQDYEDYRAVDGLRIPFILRQTDEDQGDVIITFNEVKHNISIDDARFEKPGNRSPEKAASLSSTSNTPTKKQLSAAKKTIQQDRVIAGGPNDFMEVRHLVLRGSNEQIGQALSTIARERYRAKPEASADRFRTRVQRRYIKTNYPILFERMRGVAAAYGHRIEDDAWDFSALLYLPGFSAGCSVVYYPPGVTADGNGVVSRNYEYSTGTILGARPPRGELPATARPYLIEMHPDRGYASIALCAYDLLNGVLDGINSEGLTVTMLADEEIMEKFEIDPAYEGAVGLEVTSVLRMLLDTCADVEQAKEALLMTKQYYGFIPVHYLVADRHGKAFVWEYSQAHNQEYIIENPDKPLITTNFSLHRHLEGKKPPSAEQTRTVCSRYCTLAERIAANRGKLTLDFIKESHKAVDITSPSVLFGNRPPTRTLWHALYYPERRAVQVSFYLRDEVDPDQSGKARIVRSDYLEFALKNGKTPRKVSPTPRRATRAKPGLTVK